MKHRIGHLRPVSASAVMVIALATACDPQAQRGAGQAIGHVILEGAEEQARFMIDREVTPLLVASVVGGFAPSGRPALLNGLLADAWWDDRLQTVAAESDPFQDIYPHSPLKQVVNSHK